MTNLNKFLAAVAASDILARFDAGDILNSETGRVDMRSVKSEAIIPATVTTANGTTLKLWQVYAILEGRNQSTLNLKNDTEWCAVIDTVIKPWLMEQRPDATWVNPKIYAKRERATVDIAADDIQF